MHGAPGPNEKHLILLAPQTPQRTTNLQVVMRIISRIHAYYRCWWTSIWKHSYQDEKSVVDPVEFSVEFGGEAVLL